MRADVLQSSENVNDHVFLNRGRIWSGLVCQLLSGSLVDIFDKNCLTDGSSGWQHCSQQLACQTTIWTTSGWRS